MTLDNDTLMDLSYINGLEASYQEAQQELLSRYEMLAFTGAPVAEYLELDQLQRNLNAHVAEARNAKNAILSPN